MKSRLGNIRRGGAASCFLAAVFAFAAAQTANAEWWAFKGCDTTSTPCYWNASGNWYVSGSNWSKFKTTTCNNMHINANADGKDKPGFNSKWNKVITFDECSAFKGQLKFCAGSSSSPIKFVAKDGTSSYGIDSSNNLLFTGDGYTSSPFLEIESGTYRFNQVQIGTDAGKPCTLRMTGGAFSTSGDLVFGNESGAGTLTMDGGTVTVSSGKWTKSNGGTGTINLNGGTLETQHIRDDAGSLAVNFNGGTLKANGLSSEGLLYHGEGSGLAVTVGRKGGTVDTGNYDIVIPVAVNNASGAAGAMTFTGGGTVTFTAAPEVKVLVAPGTKIVASASIAETVLSNGLELAGAPALGTPCMVLTSNEDLSGLSLDNVTCGAASAFTPTLGEGNTSIVVTVSAYAPGYWTGAANDGDLSNAANWLDGNVPTSGNADIFCATNSTLAKGETFAPASIAFRENSAPLTINGDFSGITQISNSSPSMVEFRGAVVFAGNVDVAQDTGAIKFSGGATGVQLERKTDIHGTYNFTKTGDFTEIRDTTVKSDGVYNLLNGTFYKHNGDFHVEVGGKAVVKDAKIDSSASKKLLGAFNGLFVVTNQFVVSGNNWHYTCDSGSGTFVVNELRVKKNGKIVPAAKTIMGPGGIIRGEGYVRVLNNGSYEFGSYADWTMYHNDKGTNTATGEPVFYRAQDSSSWSYLTFDTTDYYDSAVGRTITCEAPISAVASAADKFRVTVKGKGKFVFANTSSSATLFSGGLVVQDSATIEVKPNARPGAGAITLGAGTTLALTATNGTVAALANAVALPTGENEKAAIRIDGTSLKPGKHIVLSNVAVGTTDNATLDMAGEALGGCKRAKLALDGTDLVLTIPHSALIIIVR